MDAAGDTLYPRLLMSSVRTALADTPVVALLGPRQCGKTTLARMLAPEYGYFSLDDEATRAFAATDPAGFAAALPARAVIDEIQRAPALLRALKLIVDRERRPGRFVLTGSANLLLLPDLGDSLAGRMEILQLEPLTQAERARAPGRFLASLLEGGLKPALTSAAPTSGQPTLAERVTTGGFPEAVARPPSRARAWHRAYLRALLERDVRDVARVRDVAAVGRLLEMIALRTGELLNITSLGNELGLQRATVDHHLAILERLYLVRRLLPWQRSPAARLVKSPKIHVVDSGLGASLGGLTAERWNTQRERAGHLLESFVLQQLVAQAGWTDPELRFWHYRDKDQVEVDVVITRGRETWGVEVKSAMTAGPSDGRGLRRLAEQCGKDYRAGVLLYAGAHTFPLEDGRNLAVPLARLWDS